MTRGSGYYLWYQKTPGLPAIPFSVSTEPAPADLVGVYSVPIGHSGAARFGEMLSHGIAEGVKLTNRYLLIDKLLPPWAEP